ncbi:hypothetical protein [Thermococcus pacificus]|uniref:hypothetical protein n=1 Tax=Thermococcus pacificus TaxID=71998 RepID=UPI001E55E2BE|nr:hypothetical protein [Thermococcus pacificus]
MRVALYISTIITGLIGIITVVPLVAELYLFHVLKRVDAKITDEGVLASFSAINVLLAVAVHSNDPNVDPLLPTIITALTFLFLAIKLESGAGNEVCGDHPG